MEKEKYEHAKIEAKWQKYWADKQIYKTDLDGALLPFYNLMMFPYPSAEGLHIGGMYTFTGVDTYGRYMRMKGNNVFEPMGLDAFGIHSENYAIKIGEHIKTVSQRTEKHFYEQMHMMGNMFDWDHKVETNKEEYYKWTQWLFIQFFKAGLAYRKEAIVKFCPSCKTVVSDEQVIDGKCERCSTVVEEKDLKQWFFKITKYADRLDKNLEKIDWDREVKLGQKNWINKKYGVDITYHVDKTDQEIVCFTTRPDTNFGATFVVLAPEHSFVSKIISGEIKSDEKTRNELKAYVAKVKSKSEIERIAQGREKTGIFTGFYCINQLTNKKMPIWTSDFVLAQFGTGAVVGVPGHDKRDFEFALKFGIEIIRVVVGKDGDKSAITKIDQVQEEEGVMINSKFLDGMDIHKATEKISNYIVEKGWGKKVLNFNLRDWCVSRQRYWGPPIPMIYCEKCAKESKSWFSENPVESHKDMMENELTQIKEDMKGWYPDENLPVRLPEIESFEAIKPDGSGRGPLASRPEFVKTVCPQCGSPAKRETDVSDPFVDSCWYFLRYPFTDFPEIPFGGHFDNPKSFFKPKIDKKRMDIAKARMKKWGPVNSYIGGKEHTVLHLLYARFITMAFKDMGYIDFEEPFTRFFGHGLITKDGAKMSKSKGNVVNPDEYIAKYGADAVRLYLRFIGPFDQAGDWRDSGMEGMHRFVKKLWKIFINDFGDKNYKPAKELEDESKIHKTIKEVGEDLETLKFNTAVALLMEYVNWYQDSKEKFSYKKRIICLENLALMLAPLAPHIAEEFWVMLGHKTSIHLEKWPEFDEAKTTQDKIIIAIQVNGKFRGTVELQKGSKQQEVIKMAESQAHIAKYLEKGIKKVIYIPDKIINIIVPVN